MTARARPRNAPNGKEPIRTPPAGHVDLPTYSVSREAHLIPRVCPVSPRTHLLDPVIPHGMVKTGWVDCVQHGKTLCWLVK